MPKQRHLLTTAEVAQTLNEDPRTVQRKAKSGEYKAIKLPGLRGAYVFDPAEVRRIQKARKTEAAA